MTVQFLKLHGTAPNTLGLDRVNPVLYFIWCDDAGYMGWQEAADLIKQGIGSDR